MAITKKKTRKSGGNAWNPAPADIMKLLEKINIFTFFIRDPRMEGNSQPGYREYLEHLGYFGSAPNSGPDLQRIDEYLRSLWSDEEFAGFKMRWLEEVLRLLPEELALDVLSKSPHFKQKGVKKILSSLRDQTARLFENDDPRKCYGDHDIMDLYYCLSGYEEFYVILLFLEGISEAWAEYKPRAESFFENKDSKNLYFQIFGLPSKNSPYIRVGVDSEFRLQFYLSEYFRILNNVEIERIRLCPRCRKFFWAGRKDMIGCSLCSPILRKKRWRDSVSQEAKTLYNQARKKKKDRLKS